MPQPQILSAAEQMAAYLRDELHKRRWKGAMPGVSRLAREFDINKNTIEAALALLEKEGYLLNQGPARRRLIRIPEGAAAFLTCPLKIPWLDLKDMPRR